MEKRVRYKKFIEYFNTHNPAATTELNYSNAYELLVATLLSARCTDKRVNLTTPDFFEAFPSPRILAKYTSEEVFPYIKSVTFPNNKAKYLVSMAQTIVKDFGGKVPEDAKDLQKLAGIGRKSAHVIMSTLHGEAKMVVDTHVSRVSKRIGLVPENAKTPLQIEKELVKNVPNKYIAVFHNWLILHGRYICKAIKPLCNKCPITDICLYYEKIKSNK